MSWISEEGRPVKQAWSGDGHQEVDDEAVEVTEVSV